MLATAALVLWVAPAIAAADAQMDPADTAADAQSAKDARESVEWPNPVDWTKLDWHPAADPAFDPAPRHVSIPAPPAAPATAWSRTENADGSAAVTVKRSLTTGWDSSIGADVTLAPPPSWSAPINPAALLPGANTDSSAGAAWAMLATPSQDAPVGLERTALGVRLDSSQTQRKFGVNASKSLVLGEQVSLTLQGGYAATDFPATGAPAPLPPSRSYAARVYTTEEVARLTILPTHTTIAAGRTLSSTDERWLRNVSAEQQLFKGVSIAGSFSESPGGPPTTSIVAKFQRRW